MEILHKIGTPLISNVIKIGGIDESNVWITAPEQ